MRNEWHLNEEQSHALFAALLANAKNPRLRYYRGIENIHIWLEILRPGARLNILPTDLDAEFFPALIEQEIIRLASYEAEDTLSLCGCRVFIHRRALQQFRLKNLEP